MWVKPSKPLPAVLPGTELASSSPRDLVVQRVLILLLWRMSMSLRLIDALRSA